MHQPLEAAGGGARDRIHFEIAQAGLEWRREGGPATYRVRIYTHSHTWIEGEGHIYTHHRDIEEGAASRKGEVVSLARSLGRAIETFHVAPVDK